MVEPKIQVVAFQAIILPEGSRTNIYLMHYDWLPLQQALYPTPAWLSG